MTQPPATRRSNPLFPIIVLLLVVALAVEGYLLLRPKQPERPAEAQQAIAVGPEEIETFGDQSAALQIEFYAPLVLPWHQETIRLLRQYHEAHPGRTYVTLMPMGRAECDDQMQELGYTCAVILINGEKNFTLPDGRQVSLEKRPNEPSSFYNSEDVITILDQLTE